ncbi:DUF3862 domain-containing protein [Heliobacterium chlorum]|uniref:DUF3862 domain-containing protein n=1 Tax=Heliobacterium chlorum TaxID=2698 RepID=A0ABR7SYL2_HELCL|nr:DUF3862 domain-containing protein [Heliobacterium chlorum]MBC9782947.1 DUF3862 domain-containing protein [Heliobacterium chlorum]
MNKKIIYSASVLILATLLAGCGGAGTTNKTNATADKAPQTAQESKDTAQNTTVEKKVTPTETVVTLGKKSNITLEKYNKLDKGMTYEEAVKIMGKPGQETREENSSEVKCLWKNSDNTSAEATFKDGKLTTKKQEGLK